MKAASIKLSDDVLKLTLMIINKVLEKRYREDLVNGLSKQYLEFIPRLFTAIFQQQKALGMKINSELLEELEMIKEQIETLKKGVGEK
ncbi:MAG: hypothetical protein IPM91_08805 [Bacteroidetes bacterium]|nr:hypothetical protein [Bacteroidota bacterium]